MRRAGLEGLVGPPLGRERGRKGSRSLTSMPKLSASPFSALELDLCALEVGDASVAAAESMDVSPSWCVGPAVAGDIAVSDWTVADAVLLRGMV